MEIVYAREVVKSHIPNLSESVRSIIIKAIEKKLVVDPYLFGKPLKGSLKGLRSLRIGDYRVIYKIGEKTVYVVAIGHRSNCYES